MTQVQLAERLGIAQQTLAHYEVGRLRIAADLLPVLGEVLGLSLDELLIGQARGRPPGKRGPASRLQLQVEAVSQLPKRDQDALMRTIDAFLTRAPTARQGREQAA